MALFVFLRLFGSDIGRKDNHNIIISGIEVAVGKSDEMN